MKMNVTILLGHANFDYQCKLFESLWQGHRHVITNYFFSIVIIIQDCCHLRNFCLHFIKIITIPRKDKSRECQLKLI